MCRQAVECSQRSGEVERGVRPPENAGREVGVDDQNHCRHTERAHRQREVPARLARHAPQRTPGEKQQESGQQYQAGQTIEIIHAVEIVLRVENGALAARRVQLEAEQTAGGRQLRHEQAAVDELGQADVADNGDVRGIVKGVLHVFQTEALDGHALILPIQRIARLLLGGAQILGRLLLLTHALGIGLSVAVHGALVIEPAAQSGAQQHHGQRAHVPLPGQRHAQAYTGGDAEDLGIGQPRAKQKQQRKADDAVHHGGGQLPAAHGRKHGNHGEHAEDGALRIGQPEPAAPADAKLRIRGHACPGQDGHERDRRDQVQVDRAHVLEHVQKARRAPKERDQAEGIDRQLRNADKVCQVGDRVCIAHAAAGKHMCAPEHGEHAAQDQIGAPAVREHERQHRGSRQQKHPQRKRNARAAAKRLRPE